MQWLNCSYFLLMKRKFAKVGSKTAPKLEVKQRQSRNMGGSHWMLKGLMVSSSNKCNFLAVL